jgi:c-di-GMP phosphodiesterase
LAPSVKRSIPYAQVGVQSIAMMERCFATGAFAVVGWPFEDTLKHAGSVNTNPDFTTISRLIQLIDKGGDVTDMEALIRRDPALAYRLMRYINSPGFGLRVEIQSFRHAVMMLGYAKLRRWLTLLVTTSCKDANMRPIMFASFRRGLFLEHLIGSDQDQSMRDEVFILGVFSLLDKLFKEPFEKLFSVLHVPERVQETLIGGTGPYALYLAIAEAVEQGPSASLPEKLMSAVMSIEQCNKAVVRSLMTSDLASS